MSVSDYLLNYYIEQNGEAISEELADILVSNMKKSIPLEDVKKIGDTIGIDWDSVLLPEFYSVYNKLYSEYSDIFSKYGLDNPVMIGDMAHKWFKTLGGNKRKTLQLFLYPLPDCRRLLFQL